MAYIVVLNPLIIGTAQDSTGHFLGGGDAPNLPLVAAATALVAGVMTILMGVVANYPLALATGLGLNAFVAFGIATLPKMTWADAMGLVVIEGVIILVLVLTGFRTAVFRAVPTQAKTAISVGIGLFITIIGLFDAGFVRKPAGPTPVEPRRRRVPRRLAVGRVRRRPARHHRDDGAAGARRDPVRHPRRHRARGDHRGGRARRLADRRHRQAWSTPPAGA
ncbi:hypothetical protein GCM10025868_16310 [Angustibacter aerolatus]|uniref:SLC26A/SulP transporter domain-containing protein n=1 Tax=Angustibacter aerolatus TaxID=1162965 RepID=A0ABQ6JDW6_9ACTN|nr:solute carrier family 23 protein [Angustibacter aerolatus]GMA86381.1 hypothetical protein GCM10025868_16310 [Angustibacter aerolatus]